MRKNDLLAICRYYKGEDDCPFGPGEAGERFWTLERDYVRFHGQERSDIWETEGLEMAFGLSPLLAQFLDAKGFSAEQKGMLACMAVLSNEHNPMGGVDFLFEYGK